MSNWACDGHRLGWPKVGFSWDIPAGSLSSHTFSAQKYMHQVQVSKDKICASRYFSKCRYYFILAIKFSADTFRTYNLSFQARRVRRDILLRRLCRILQDMWVHVL